MTLPNQTYRLSISEPDSMIQALPVNGPRDETLRGILLSACCRYRRKLPLSTAQDSINDG
jgi:hypothetical protein